MNKKSAIGIAVIMAGITLTSMSSGEVFAQNDPQRNNFGEGASHLGQNQLMGGHSREGGSAGTAPFDGPDAFDTEKGRTGIGNIAHPVHSVRHREDRLGD